MMTPKERAVMQPSQQAVAAMRLALEALEMHAHGAGSVIHSKLAWDALREALANTRSSIRSTSEYSEQAEQEPIRFIWNGEGWIEADDYIWKTTDDYERRILYAAPLAKQDTHATHVVRTKDLTDDEIMKINVDTASIVPTCDRQFHFARAVIAADREKNK